MGRQPTGIRCDRSDWSMHLRWRPRSYLCGGTAGKRTCWSGSWGGL